jgi:cellobiose phosphorylase
LLDRLAVFPARPAEADDLVFDPAIGEHCQGYRAQRRLGVRPLASSTSRGSCQR